MRSESRSHQVQLRGSSPEPRGRCPDAAGLVLTQGLLPESGHIEVIFGSPSVLCGTARVAIDTPGSWRQRRETAWRGETPGHVHTTFTYTVRKWQNQETDAILM